MALTKRIVLFLATNFLIVVTISLLFNIFGLAPYFSEYGLNLPALIIASLVWGMLGALISLALSRITAKRMMSIKLIGPNAPNAEEHSLFEMVKTLCQNAKLSTMPEVGIYESSELNAFATGPTKARSLIAVSRGLLTHMNDTQRAAVLGHEVAHVANGDMVTMTLLQGIVNAFSIFLSRVVAYIIAQIMRERGQGGLSYMIYFALSMILQIVFLALGSIVVAWFSRSREYRADLGGARLAGRENMISALSVLERTYESVLVQDRESSISNLKISAKEFGIFKLFATHPPLAKRIARLREITKLPAEF